MSHESNRLSRRDFLHDAGALGSAALLLNTQTMVRAAEPAVADALPRRILGRTQQEVTALALGTWPCGRSETVDTVGVAAIVNEAIDLGIDFIDTAHNYGNAEEGIGKALGKRRDQVFLTTKVWADDEAEARTSFEESLRALQTDHVDLVYLHSVGNRDVQRAMADDGALAYLLRQKQAGKTRFVGISGHSRVETFVPVIESDQIDVVMMAMNFVDRYTYGFEEKVLPVAIKHNVGVACMKVFGGIRGGFGVAGGPNPGPQMNKPWLEQAVAYAMGLPGVATLVIGPHTIEQLRDNVRMVKDYRPLTAEQHAGLAQLGKQLATQWGEHYGPVA
jgi:predicted aldo/keto reductase-like oxidoreductase